MSSAETWIVIAGLTLVTVVTRSFFLVLGDHVPLPQRVQHALRYAPPCALAALVAPEVLFNPGLVLVGPGDPKLVAAVAAVVAMLVTRSMLAAMTIGMLALAAVRVLQ